MLMHMSSRKRLLRFVITLGGGGIPEFEEADHKIHNELVDGNLGPM